MPDKGPGIGLIIAIVVFGAVAYVLWRAPSARVSRALSSVFSIGRIENPAPPASEGPPSRGKVKSARTVAARQKEHEKPGAPAQAPSTVEIVVKLPSLPDAKTVQKGMTSSRLLDLYGEPEMRTFTVHGGQSIEKYVYLGERNRVAYILVQNGYVVSIQTEDWLPYRLLPKLAGPIR